MVVTSEVETSSLLGTFDLHPYDNFLPSEVYNQQYSEAVEVAKQNKVCGGAAVTGIACLLDGLQPWLWDSLYSLYMHGKIPHIHDVLGHGCCCVTPLAAPLLPASTLRRRRRWRLLAPKPRSNGL